jgi:hypothetical protein
MRWKYSQENLVLIAEIDKIHGKVGSMAINDKKVAIFFLLSLLYAC